LVEMTTSFLSNLDFAMMTAGFSASHNPSVVVVTARCRLGWLTWMMLHCTTPWPSHSHVRFVAGGYGSDPGRCGCCPRSWCSL